MKNIYIYETRKLNYLNAYVKKVRTLGFNPIIIDSGSLENSLRFKKFFSLYEHLSVGTVEFEVSCFARYFALAEHITHDEPFILSDSDVYVTDSLKMLNLANYDGVFVGSEGFCKQGSEHQISPHFSIWNKQLLNDFVDFLIHIYERNSRDKFLSIYYEKQKKLLGRTSISDMTILYLWVKEKKIPYLNSNNYLNGIYLDHNISALYEEKRVYQSFSNRKKIKRDNDCFNALLVDGRKIPLLIIHFQGGYKRVLYDFYNKRYLKFYIFSIYINLGRRIYNKIRK